MFIKRTVNRQQLEKFKFVNYPEFATEVTPYLHITKRANIGKILINNIWMKTRKTTWSNNVIDKRNIKDRNIQIIILIDSTNMYLK